MAGETQQLTSGRVPIDQQRDYGAAQPLMNPAVRQYHNPRKTELPLSKYVAVLRHCCF